MCGFTYEWVEAVCCYQSQHTLRPLQPVGLENSQVTCFVLYLFFGELLTSLRLCLSPLPVPSVPLSLPLAA
jgi:hypothetical protein